MAMKNIQKLVLGKSIHGDEVKCEFLNRVACFQQILLSIILYRLINRKSYLLFSSLSFLKDI